MELYRAHEDPLPGSLQVYKQSVISAFLGLLVVWGIGAAVAVAILRGGAPGFLWIIVGIIALISLLFLGMLRAAMGPDNWVVKFDGSRLAFKFRSYLNRHFPAEDKVVAVFPASAFEWIREAREKKTVPGNKGQTTRETTIYLELKLKDAGIAEALDGLVREEILREAPKIGNGRTKHHHVPMRVVDGSTLRVCWRSPRDYIRPGIRVALKNLESSIRIEEAVKSEQGDYRQMTPEELDAYVSDLAQSGNRMKAAKVIREAHGLGIRESKAYLDTLIQARNSNRDES